MATPKTTIWDLEPHTRAKHAILHRYLQAWVPILSQGGFRHVLYVDGFAGPGRYSKGEPGSPIIALRAALEQRTVPDTTFHFLFIEEDKARGQVLRQIIAEMNLPANFDVRVDDERTFEVAFRELRQRYQRIDKPLPPTFAFIDPFGWKGLPFSVVGEILNCQSCEVLVTFMYEEINRFIGHPDQESNFDTFFGTPRWREGIGLTEARARNRFFHDLYLSQLRDAAKVAHVRSFEMRNERDVTDYFLFYATNSLLGLKKMKEAMWRVDELGEFSFSDATNETQLVLFERKPPLEELLRQILDRFDGHEATVSEIETFVIAKTAFRETHYKSQVLKPLELANPPLIQAVNPSQGRRLGTYADRNLRLRFISPPSRMLDFSIGH
jgi:three-Cys-motif partner protein